MSAATWSAAVVVESTSSTPPPVAFTPHPARETVSFNFGWRFHRGDPPDLKQPYCSRNTATAFPETVKFPCQLDGDPTHSLIFAPLRSADDCAKACCPGGGYHPNCTVWAFCAKNQPALWTENVTQGCYLGGPETKCGLSTSSSIKWSSGRRDSPIWPTRDVPDFAAVGFDDREWEQITAPHDFVVEGEFSPDAPDEGNHGYLPREEPGWYRKTFSLPSEWTAPDAGKQVWLHFDGVFRVTEAYIDGEPIELIGTGAVNGYTSFDTAPLELSRGNNTHVIALRVDASFGSGHWYEGGGLYRNVYMVATNQNLHLQSDTGLFAYTQDNNSIQVCVFSSGVFSSGACTELCSYIAHFCI